MKTMSLAIVAAAALVACGGGGVDSASASLAGTAAVGAPLRNATVTLKDSNGKTLTTTADANGAYVFDSMAGMVAPLMLQASGTAGGVDYKLHSFLSKAPDSGVRGVLNVTPATESVVAQAVGKAPSALFDATDAATQIKAVDGAKLINAKARLVASLGDVLAALDLDSSKVDVFTTAFAANGAGMDKLLDIIQFQAADNGSGDQIITVTNKSTGAGVSIAPTLVAGITKVAPPSAGDLALNTNTITNLLTAFNAQAKTVDGINSDAMRDLFDADYLSSGNNRAAQLAMIAADSVGSELTDYVLRGCDGATKTCKVQISWKEANKPIGKMETQVILGSDDKWRAYGDRFSFDFDLKPVVRADYWVTNGVAELSGGVGTGFNLWFPGGAQGALTRAYKSAKVQTSNDNGVTWSAAVKFAEKSACPGRDYLPLDGANPYDCSNFMAISDESALAANAATLAGTGKYRITAYPNADYTGTAVVHEDRATRLRYTSTTGQAALSSEAPSITAGDLGSNSVRFAGPTTYVQIKAVTMSGATTLATGRTSWSRSKIATLAGEASVAKANALCLHYGDTAEVCDASYGPNAKISGIHLENRDAQGRGIWVDYSTNVQ